MGHARRVAYGVSGGVLLRLSVTVSLFWTVATALTVSTPPYCGAPRVITHANAFFGPRLSQPSANLLPIFAAYPTINSGAGKDIIHGTQKLDTGCALWRKRDTPGGKIEKARWKGVKGKVGVVIRGDCDFIEKVLGLEQLGAVGVVVVNRPEEAKLANMKVNDTQRHLKSRISAVMVTWRDWVLLSACREKGVKVSFTRDGEATLDADYEEKDVLNWILIKGMALWILCQCGVNAVRYKKRAGELRARADAIAALPTARFIRSGHGRRKGEECVDCGLLETKDEKCKQNMKKECESDSRSASPFSGSPWWRLGRRSTVATREPICRKISSSSKTRGCHLEHSGSEDKAKGSEEQSIGSGQFDSLDRSPSLSKSLLSDAATNESDEPVCPVCLEYFHEGQTIRILECGHEYCIPCIDKWLNESSNSCPICKKDVPNLGPPPLQPGGISINDSIRV